MQGLSSYYCADSILPKVKFAHMFSVDVLIFANEEVLIVSYVVSENDLASYIANYKQCYFPKDGK